MQEVSRFISQCGFNTDVTPDGSIHRFKIDQSDSKESGWYIFFQNHSTKGGQVYYVGLVGNWRTGEEFSYQSQIPLSKQDKAAAHARLEQARKKAETEKRQKQLMAKAECDQIWDSLKEGISDYHKRKGLNAAHGARLKPDLMQGAALAVIPMRDVDGQLWNIQKIGQEKRFHFGGRVLGCFHVIGNIADPELILCEGFATASSIHEATRRTVICTFSAVNLVHAGGALKARYPEKTFIIAGDNDEKGIEKAEEAAKKTLGKAVFPKESGKDFNDVSHSEIKEIILGVKVEKHYVIPLGFNQETYYFVSSLNQQIQSISASGLTSSGFLRLQPLHYWESTYPGDKGGVNWQQAASDLMTKCAQKGIFYPERIRGRGVWVDQGRVIYHRGKRLWPDAGLHEIDSKYTYNQCQEMPELHDRPLTVAECNSFLDASAMIQFKRNETDHVIFTGWLAIAPVCGALDWRPHVWLSGASGTGKSTILNDIVKPLLTGFSYFFSGQTTEAGVRQMSGVSALPVIFDEFETNDGFDTRIKSILELARQASSDSEAVIAKGSAGGDAVTFKPRFAMMASSVRTGLKHEEDKNRFMTLELMRHDQDNQSTQYDALKKNIIHIQGDYGARLFSRTVRMLPTILESQKVVFKAAGETVGSMRLAQQISAVVAGFWSLKSDLAITEEQAKSIVSQMTFEEEKSLSGDEDECLENLLGRFIYTGTSNKSIRTMLDEKTENKILLEHGVYVEDDFFYVQAGNFQIKEIYSKTKWASCFPKTLSRLEGVLTNQNKAIKGTRKTIRCIKIPISYIS